jgi:serine/threonine protein kinase
MDEEEILLLLSQGWAHGTSEAGRMSTTLQHLSKFFGKLVGNQPPDEATGPAESPPAPPGGGQEGRTSTLPAIPGHQLLRFIGQGAYGEVWLALDEIGAFHGVKIVRKKTFADRGPFEREYRGILQYTPISRTHQALVHILNVGRNNEAGFFFYVMELADCVHNGRNIVPETYTARTLAHDLDTRGRLSVRECVVLGIDLTEGLRYLHGKQLVHRDVKPANIIFVNGIPKLADVGLVTHVAEAKRDVKDLGTHGYVPPEGPGTQGADVYSLGKVLGETSAGRPETQSAAFAGLDEGEQDALVQLNEILFRACHEDAGSRYPSVDEFQGALIQLQDQLSDDSALPGEHSAAR